MTLDRPLVIFDLETTGLDTAADRITEAFFLRFPAGTDLTDGNVEIGGDNSLYLALDPEREICPDAIRVTGITNESRRGLPTFASRAEELGTFLRNCDLCGFNALHYDIPLLRAEFQRCGYDLSLTDRRIIDAKIIYHKFEGRTLTDAVRFYLNADHEGAHGAEADVRATARVLAAQVGRYAPDIPSDPQGLSDLCWPADRIDLTGKFTWKEGHATCNFGKHRGSTLNDMTRNRSARSYLEWMLTGTFDTDVKALVRNALEGKFPVAPPTTTSDTAIEDS